MMDGVLRKNASGYFKMTNDTKNAKVNLEVVVSKVAKII